MDEGQPVENPIVEEPVPSEIEPATEELIIEEPAATDIDTNYILDEDLYTSFYVPDYGSIQVLHQVSFGELIIATMLLFILVFMILSRVIRR